MLRHIVMFRAPPSLEYRILPVCLTYPTDPHMCLTYPTDPHMCL